MNTIKTVKEIEKEELSSNQNLNERLSSIEYRLDHIAEKLSNMSYQISFDDKWPRLGPLYKVDPVITSHLQFVTSENKVILNLFGEHFSKSNYLRVPNLIRTTYISVYHAPLRGGSGFVFFPSFPKNVPIDENGKFHIQIPISVDGFFKIVARDNSTDKYAPHILFNLNLDQTGGGYGLED